jgi:hypothetical protein
MADSPADTASASSPELQEALETIGFRVDEMAGSSIGRVHGVYVDEQTGEPAWVVVKLGRFGKVTLIPYRDCAPGAGHLWAAYEREVLRGAPAINEGDPLTREQELEICAHYGIRGDQARAGEIAEREEGAVTAQPPGAADSS